MTQTIGAQDPRNPVARKMRGKGRTLAQRRADFEAQMHAMALADLEQLADRLKELHSRLEHRNGRKWTQIEVAEGADVPYRTYQSWIGGKNENRDGTGYEALARFYRRKLSDKMITRNWIVFGAQEPPEESAPASKDPYAEQLDRIEEKLDEVLKRLGGDEEVPVDLPDEPESPPGAPSEDVSGTG